MTRTAIMLQRVTGLVLLCALGGLVGGCATVGGNPDDPLEPYNRAMYSFNDSVDKAFVKPVATGYKKVVPEFARTGVTNFFSNLGDVWIGVNDILQGKIGPGVSDFGRFAINTTVGIVGLFDVASKAGLQKHNEDFGQTLGRWGVGSGPYVVLPFLGPSDVRDGFSLLAVDWHGDPLWYVNNIPTRNELYGVRLLNTRANLLDASRLMEEAALDPYAYVRSAYLQHRRSLVYDGNPPPPKPEPGPDSKSGPSGAPVAQAGPAGPALAPAPLNASQGGATVAAVRSRSYEPIVPRNYAAVLEHSGGISEDLQGARR
jgi:phospholipid-binding lipoprotein MlaA